MDKNDGGGGVKVTYIETRFVTSDTAGFKDLVQRLTGRAAVAPAPAPHRPRPCRAAAAAGPQGCSYTTPSVAPPCQLEDLDGFFELFCFGANDHRRGPHNGGYNDFPY